MSRVDEALRRAAETGTEPSALPLPPGDELPAEPAHATALAEEPFPVELTGRGRARIEAPKAPEPPPPIAPPSPDDKPADNGRPSSRLFERIDSMLAEKVVADANMSPISREQYRRLGAVLHDAQATAGLRVIMIASAVPGEGKTLTATNLALTLSESYQNRVLLIDADIRKPALHRVFGIQAASGLVEGLDASAGHKLVLRQVSSRLSVLPAGRPTSDPMAALTSSRMRQLIEEAKENFDWIILDTPPLMLLPDAHLLSGLVDGAVLVVRANSTAHELVRRTVEIIGRERIAGVVLNQANTSPHGTYGAHHHYHGYYLARQESGDS